MEKAVSRSLRVLLEDHLYWAVVADRYSESAQGARYLEGYLRTPDGRPLARGFVFELLRRRMVAKMAGQMRAQGMIRLGQGRVQKAGIEDLEAVSTFLGSKSYIMGGDK